MDPLQLLLLAETSKPCTEKHNENVYYLSSAILTYMSQLEA